MLRKYEKYTNFLTPRTKISVQNFKTSSLIFSTNNELTVVNLWHWSSQSAVYQPDPSECFCLVSVCLFKVFTNKGETEPMQRDPANTRHPLFWYFTGLALCSCTALLRHAARDFGMY